MNDPLGLFDEGAGADPLGLFEEDQSYWDRVGGLGGIAKSVGGAAVGLGDYISGIPAFAAGTALATMGTLSGTDPKIAREAAHAAAAEKLPVLSESLKKFGIDVTDTGGYKTMMSPIEAISNLIEQGGEKAGELIGSKEFGEGTKIATELGMLGLGGVEAKSRIPKDFTEFKGKPEPLREEPSIRPPMEQETAIPKDQLELFTEDTKNNMYRAQPKEIDELGMPYNRALSEDVQMAQRAEQPDLFGKENLDNLRKQDEIEAAYRQRDELQKSEAKEVSEMLEYPPDEYLPSQSGINKGFRSKQSGAVDPVVVKEALENLVGSLKKWPKVTVSQLKTLGVSPGDLDQLTRQAGIHETPLGKDLGKQKDGFDLVLPNNKTRPVVWEPRIKSQKDLKETVVGPGEKTTNQAVVDVRIRAQDKIANNDFRGAMESVRDLQNNPDVLPGAQFLGHLADAILKNKNIVPETALGKEQGMGGSFSNLTGKLKWNSPHIYDLMHEAVHASVNKALIMFNEGKQHLLSVGQRIAARHVDEVYKNALSRKQELIDFLINKGYDIPNAVNKAGNALSNVREFTAYSATEPHLREFLTKTPYKGFQSFASVLGEAYRRLIKMEDKFQTEFDRFMWGTERLISESDGKYTSVGIDKSGWNGKSKLADGTKIKLKDGKIVKVVTSTPIKETNRAAWQAEYHKLHDQAFGEYLANTDLSKSKELWNSADQKFQYLLNLNDTKLNKLLNPPDASLKWIPKAEINGKLRPIFEDMIDTVFTGPTVDYSKKITGWEKYETPEKVGYEDLAPTFRGKVDLQEKPGYVFTNILSSGKMQSWMLNHPAVRAIVDMTTRHINDAKLASEKSLFDRDVGVVAKLTRIEKLFKPGEAEKVLLERIKAQRDSEYTPALNSDQLKLYKELDNLFKDRGDKINAVLEGQGRKAITLLQNYFPSRWRGEFMAAVFEKKADGSQGRLLTYVRETSRGAAEDATKFLQGKYGDDFIIGKVDHVPAVGKNKFQKSMGTAHAELENLFEFLGSEDPLTMKAVEAVQKLSAKQAFDTLNTKQHFKYKSGIEGFLGGKEWLSPKDNYYQAKDSMISYIEAVDQWLAANKIDEFMKQMEADPAVQAPKAIGFGRQFIDHALGYTETSKAFKELQDAISKSIGFDSSKQRDAVMRYANFQTALYLGYYSTRGAIQNIVQPFTGILPKMVEVAVRGGSKDVLSPMLIGMTEALMYIPYDITKGQFAARPVLPKTSKQIWDYAIERHIVDPHLVETKGMFKTKGAAMSYDIVANNSIRVTEAFSRYAAFNSMVRHMLKSGMEMDRALRTAEDVSRELMVNYEPYAKSQLIDKAGLVGQMAGRLQTFKINQLTQLADYVNTAIKEGNWGGISTYLATNLMVAGSVGMIGMDVVESIWDLIKNVDRASGSPIPWVQEFSPKEAALNSPHPIAVGGLSYVTNKGMFGAFATNLLGDNMWQTAFPVYYGIGKQIEAVPKLFSDSDTSFAGGLQAFAPASARPYIEEAYLTDDAGRIKSPTTGRTVYTKGKNDIGGILKPNVPSLERAETSLRSHLAIKREKAIKDSILALEDSMKKLKDEGDFNTNKLKQKSFEKKLSRYVEMGGDFEKLDADIQNFITTNKLANQLAAKLFREKDKPTESTIRTLDDIKRLEERYGR